MNLPFVMIIDPKLNFFRLFILNFDKIIKE